MQDVQHCQRSADRFGLALPVTMEGQACACHDISATGVLLEARQAPDVGSIVSLELHYDLEGEPLHVQSRGRVVRVERHGDSYNVAVRLDQPLFEEESVLHEGGTG
jgi:hypothetical protein